MNKRILVRIDFQNDFVAPDGLLSINDCDLIEKHKEELTQKELKQQPKQIKKEDSKPKREKPIENVDSLVPIYLKDR